MNFELPSGWFVRVVIGGWALLLVGTFSLFLFPKYLASPLITPLWVLSIFVVLMTFVYAGIRVIRLSRR